MSKSVYNIIKRQNGEAFAQGIRRFDSGIFDIPNLPKIVKYAGRNVLPLLDYLESLKEIKIENITQENDPFVLLEKAGYNAFYADTLEKQNSITSYYEANELLCTFKDPDRYKRYHIIHAIKKNVHEIKRADFKGVEEREEEYGTSVISIQILKSGGFISIKNRYNHTVNACDNTFYSNPDRIIEGLSGALCSYFKVDFSVKKQVFLPDEYILVSNQILKYDIEFNNIYFGDGFYVKDGVVHLIDKNSQLQIDALILDLKTKEILDPGGKNLPLKRMLMQEIENETLQVQHQNGVVSLLGKEGFILTTRDRRLTSMTLRKVERLPVDAFRYHNALEELNALSVTSCLSHALSSCSKLNKVYFPILSNEFPSSLFDDTNCTVVAPLLEEKGIHFLGSLAIDLKKQQFLTRGDFSEGLLSLVEVVISVGNTTYQIQGDEFKIYSEKFKGQQCCKFKDGKLVELTLFASGDLKKESVIRDLPDLEVLNMPYVQSLGAHNITNCPKLKKVYLPALQSVDDNCVFNCDSLQEVYAPSLRYIGNWSFSYNKSLKKLDLPELAEVKNGGCFSSSGYEEINAPKLVRVGNSFCRHNPDLVKIHMPALKCVSEYSFMDLKSIREMDFPELQYIEGRTLIARNENLRRVSFKKLMIIPSFMLKDCPNLQEVEAKALYRVEKGALEMHPKLKRVYAPVLLNNLRGREQVYAYTKFLTDERVREG